MKIGVFLFLSLLSPMICWAQGQLKIDLERFDQLEMESQLVDAVNEYRKQQHLPLLLRDESLDAAAFDQAEYNQKNNKEGHTQEEVVKENVQKRVRFYKGLHYEIGELIYIASVGAPIKTTSTESFTINTYTDAAKAALNEWNKKKDSKTILDDNTYFNIGVAASFHPERREISIVSVIASSPYELREKKDREDDYGLVEYNKTICDLFNRKNSFLPELLSDKVFVENGKIYLENSDRELLSEILSDGRDGFTIDIVGKDQFNCDGGIKLYPSNIHYGLLLRPIKASTLNYKTPEGNFLNKIELGELPTYYQTEDVNVNLLIFKEGSVCNYIPEAKTKAKNLHWLEPKWEVFNPASEVATFYEERKFNSAETEKVLNLLDSLQNSVQPIQELSIKIDYNALSPFDSSTVKAIYQEKSKSIVKKPHISSQDTWKSIEKFIANRTIAIDVRGVSFKDKIEILNSTEDPNEINFFRSSQLTTVRFGMLKNITSEPTNSLIQEYKESIESNKINNALTIQKELIERAKNNEEAAKNVITITKMEQVRENLALISNTAIARHQLEGKKVLAEREHLRRTLLGLYLVDKTNPIISYNLCLSILYQWEMSKKAPVSPEKWEEYFKSASADSTISKDKLEKLNTNFCLLSADYYYEKGDIRERKKSLQNAYNSIMSTDNTRDEMLSYAQYYMFQLQINWAATILKKQLSKAFDAEVAANLVSISSYPSSEISEKDRSELLNKIYESEPNLFCHLFTTKSAHLLYLRNEQTKKNWCLSCQ
ncbi:CAP domain-containing protein [bacterium]|nr:CAP domain-containing protein [bacterium]